MANIYKIFVVTNVDKCQVLNVGNGLALLGITTVLCEFVLMYFIKVTFVKLKKKQPCEIIFLFKVTNICRKASR